MPRLLIAALLAAIVVTIWGAVSWTVIPWDLMVMETSGDPFSPWLLGRGFALNLVAAFLAAALLAAAAPALPRFGSRVLFVSLLAGFAALQSRLVDWNWWGLPLDTSLVAAFDLVIGWTLAGLVLAWRLSPAVPGSR